VSSIAGVVTRPATVRDVPSLGVVAPSAYAAAYGYLWEHAEHLSKHLDSFGPARLTEEMAEVGKRLWVAEIDGSIVGFLAFTTYSPDPIRHLAGGAEIPRIYLLPGARGRGIGRLLLAEATQAALEEGREYLWLDVMDSAAWAERAYLSWGFEILGRTKFDRNVRIGLNGMIVLTKNLHSGSNH
jgi:diamine N-acetyltransferase